MATASDQLPEDVDALKAALIEARAKLSGAEALIEHLRLVIAKMKREMFGPRSERTQRLIDQLELQLEELAAAAGEDESKVGAAKVQAQGFTRSTRQHAATFPPICRAGASSSPHQRPARAAAVASSPRSAKMSPRHSM